MSAMTLHAVPSSSGRTPARPLLSAWSALFAQSRRTPWLAPLRRWPVTVLVFGLAVAAAVTAAKKYGQHLWQIEGTLVHTPLPVSEQITDKSHTIYKPSNAQTLLSLVKSPQSLEDVVRDLDLPISAKALDKSLRVTKVPTADAISLVLEWPDPEVGKAVVTRIMDLHSDRVVALRREKIAESLTLLRSELTTSQERQAKLQAAYDALPAGTNAERLKHERETVAKDVSILSMDLAQLREQIAKVREKIARNVAREKALAAAPPDGTGRPDLDDVSAPYRRRQDELLDAIREAEHKLAEGESQIATRQKDAARLRPLLATQSINPAEVEAITDQVKLLEIRQANTRAAVAARRRELAELPVNQVRSDRVELERELSRLESRAAVLDGELAANRKEAARIGDLITAEAVLTKQLDRAEADTRDVESRIASLERLDSSGVREVMAAHPASASAQPTSSNKKSLAVVAFAAVFGAGMALLLGHAWLTAPRAVPPAATYGLPVLAAADPGDGAAADRAAEARQLALRLRPAVRQSGGVILFTTADEAAGTDDVAAHLARYLALGGESVLVVDARVGRPGGWDAALFPAAARPAPPAGQRPVPVAARPGPDDLPAVRSYSSGRFALGPAVGDAVCVAGPAVTRPEAARPGRSPQAADTWADGDSDVVPLARWEDGPQPGLAHALQAPANIDVAAFVERTALDKVHFMPVGGAFPSPDLLASAAMHRLLVQMSERYNRVLVLGPPAADDPVVTEILAGYADGAVVGLRLGAAESVRAAQAVQTIRAAGVPWVGAVVRA